MNLSRALLRFASVAAGWMSLSEVITIMKLFVVNDVRNAVKFSFMTLFELLTHVSAAARSTNFCWWYCWALQQVVHPLPEEF